MFSNFIVYNIRGNGRIHEAIEKNESIEVLQQLCSNGVPNELRGEVWRSALGVRKRPDAIGTWEGPLDYENQTLIHKQCQQQAGTCTITTNVLYTYLITNMYVLV